MDTVSEYRTREHKSNAYATDMHNERACEERDGWDKSFLFSFPPPGSTIAAMRALATRDADKPGANTQKQPLECTV